MTNRGSSRVYWESHHFLIVKISIIVPAFNEEKLLGATLARIQAAATAFTDQRWEQELIVCDNNSTDRTPEIARSAGATVVFEPVNQISRARNGGASAATGDWLLFVDADSHPSRELFADLIKHIETGRYLGGGVILRLDTDQWVANLLTSGWNRLSRLKKWAAGSFVFCEGTAFRKLGGFSTELYASEEIEFCNRLRKYAREQGRDLVILTRHPMVTSARKIHLYTPWEHLRFMGRTIFSQGRTLKARDACQPWYDGRR